MQPVELQRDAGQLPDPLSRQPNGQENTAACSCVVTIELHMCRFAVVKDHDRQPRCKTAQILVD